MNVWIAQSLNFPNFRRSFLRLVGYLIGALVTIPFNIVIENTAVVLGMFGEKNKFFIVDKSMKELRTVHDI